MSRKISPTAHRKISRIEMNTKAPFSNIHNNNRDINFCNCTNESTITSNSALSPFASPTRCWQPMLDKLSRIISRAGVFLLMCSH